MNTSGIENNLQQALKNLAVEWQNTKGYWHDQKSQEFEKKYLEALPQHVARAVSVMTEVNALLRKVRSDCE